MKKELKGRKAPKKLVASQIHREVIQVFVMNYCQDMPWANAVLGALRARDMTKVYTIAKNLEETVRACTSFDENLHAVQGGLEAFRLNSQFIALVTKYQYRPGVIAGLDPEKAAIDNFKAAERRNRRLNAIFAAHTARGTERHWCVPLVRRVFSDVLGRTPFYGEILRKCDFSSGSSVKYHGELTNVARKLLGDTLSGPKAALSLFKNALWKNDHYRSFYLRSNVDGIGSLDFDDLSRAVDAKYEEVDHNILQVVPKNAGSGRTIAMESEMLNFLQKGIDLEIRERLKRVLNIDLSMQEPNQQLAYKGSLFMYDPIVTLDVKDASNGVLTEAVRAVASKRWFSLLDQCRSHTYIHDEIETPYEMFCSMGNGFCFPLETLLFSAIVIAAHRHCNAPLYFRCYGDDIICRQSVALVVIECLKAFGFRTNISKSFVFGQFRESCGANWYGGQDVTPGYYKDPVTSLSELFALHNTMRAWPKVQAYLRAISPCGLKYCVSEEWSAGRITDQAFVTPLDVAMTSPNAIYCRELQSWQFTVRLSVPEADENWPHDASCVHESRIFDSLKTSYSLHRAFQDNMILTAVLRGSDSTTPFHLREKVRYVTRAPNPVANINGIVGKQLDDLRLLWKDAPLHAA